jgi:hypothetical protein
MWLRASSLKLEFPLGTLWQEKQFSSGEDGPSFALFLVPPQ